MVSEEIKPILAIICMVGITVLLAVGIYEFVKNSNIGEKHIIATVDIKGFENNSTASFRVVLKDKDRAYGFSLAIYCNIIQSIKNLEGNEVNYTNFHYNINLDIWHDCWDDLEYVKHAEIQFPTEGLAKDFMEFLKLFLMADEIEYELEWR